MRAMVVGLIVACAAVATVDTRSRVHRSQRILREFKRQTGYPQGRPGWKIDHEIPVCLGGAAVDVIENLRWELAAESYIKDRYERQLCRAVQKQGYRLVKVVP